MFSTAYLERDDRKYQSLLIGRPAPNSISGTCFYKHKAKSIQFITIYYFSLICSYTRRRSADIISWCWPLTDILVSACTSSLLAAIENVLFFKNTTQHKMLGVILNHYIFQWRWTSQWTAVIQVIKVHCSHVTCIVPLFDIFVKKCLITSFNFKYMYWHVLELIRSLLLESLLAAKSFILVSGSSCSCYHVDTLTSNVFTSTLYELHQQNVPVVASFLRSDLTMALTGSEQTEVMELMRVREEESCNPRWPGKANTFFLYFRVNCRLFCSIFFAAVCCVSTLCRLNNRRSAACQKPPCDLELTSNTPLVWKWGMNGKTKWHKDRRGTGKEKRENETNT